MPMCPGSNVSVLFSTYLSWIYCFSLLLFFFFGSLAEELTSLVQCATRLHTGPLDRPDKPHGIPTLQLTPSSVTLHWPLKPTWISIYREPSDIL